MTAFTSAGGGLLLSIQSNEGGSAANESGDASPHSIPIALPPRGGLSECGQI